ncbi:MAG: pgk [Alphaproteobacteria bacterium]|nr:pgk [Alphaproteobacteria bacterium]
MSFETLSFKTFADLNADNKTVLLRADLNVPMQEGKVSDTTRLDRIIPTIRALQEKNARIIILAHFGRPKGKSPEDSLQPVSEVLSDLLKEKVAFISDCIGDEVKKKITAIQPREVAVLENVRYYEEEEKNDSNFARQLAALGDIYVNDAFSASHRAHASIEGLAKLLPAYAGLLMEEELNALQNALENPKRPTAAIIGGSKVSTKLSVLNNLVQKVDYLILGGGMANTFLITQGIEVGKSLCEHNMIDEAKKIMATAEKSGCKILLPVDRIAVKEFGKGVPYETVATEALPADMEAVDIGPATIEKLRGILATCKTVLWNGPMGVFEVKPFDNGTNGLAQAVAELTQNGTLISVGGGGDTVLALERAGVADKFSYLSSAGGAFLEWLEGKNLPGVQALMDANKKAA